MNPLRARWLIAPLAMVLAGCGTWATDSGQRAQEALGTVPVVELEPLKCTTDEANEFVAGVSYPPLDHTGAPWTDAPSVQKIIDRNALIVGVDDNTLALSARNLLTTNLEGFEIDLAEAIADAIDPELPVRYRIVTTADKVSAAASGEVDLSISAITINCGRAKQVAFTLPYFRITEQYLVLDDSGIATKEDSGRKCTTRGSSTTESAEDLQVDTRTECLAALQNGDVDAIHAHETFLWGFQMQDPGTRIVPTGDPQKLYGIAVAPDRIDLVRFVNSLIADDTFRDRLRVSYAEHFVTCELCAFSDAPAELPIPDLPTEWLELPGEGG
ncbi:MAG TPA: transporter substrate-binding domain-containing protein [Ilumatobacteraceae bacterium]|nr:transporter substrate-binding domain-containing protein [Ilumatobacteraceae bacterium]